MGRRTKDRSVLCSKRAVTLGRREMEVDVDTEGGEAIRKRRRRRRRCRKHEQEGLKT